MWIKRSEYEKLCAEVDDLEDKVDMLEAELKGAIFDRLNTVSASLENRTIDGINDIKKQLPELVHKEIDEYKAEDKLLLKIVKLVLGEEE